MPVYSHENYIPLDPYSIIWRYMDLNKFKSMLETSCLFFCRSDKFSDPFEGSLPRKEADFRMKADQNASESLGSQFNTLQAEENIKGIRNLHQSFKRSVVVNCWHINNYESDAMWRLYLKDNEGVAIQTTGRNIHQAMEMAKEEVSMSKIRYLNYENDIWYHEINYPHVNYSFIVPYLHKRSEFIHENEFRLFIQIEAAIGNPNYWDNEASHKGKLVFVDLNKLIEKIYLPPTIDEKATSNIRELSESLGFKFDFVKSRLSFSPIY